MESSSAEKKLCDAAAEGDAKTFKQLIEGDRFLLNKVSLTYTGKTFLHVAAAQDCVDIAAVLVGEAPKMCWARDAGGMNPVHVAAMNGSHGVLRMLVERDDFAAMERLERGETALHLCVKHRQLGALRVLVEKLGEFVCEEDDAGNTVLHWAVRLRQLEIIEYLVALNKLDTNSKNSKGQTPLQMVNPDSDKETAQCIADILKSPAHPTLAEDWLLKKRDSIMVVAILIATMAFQAAVSPTGGVWQDDTSSHKAGEAVMAYKDPNIYKNFMRSNTVAFVTSLSTILLLIVGLPLFKYRLFMWALVVIMWVSVTAVGITYGASIMVATPKIHEKSLSSVIQIGIIAWVSLMAILFIVNTLRLLFQWKSPKSRLAKSCMA
ncbi:ankyrin repeat-containing protein At2g01680-like [Salvia miltiorrhiza]|uniref:ankyrin repeat-containing protein At2g01680-like n=1 Tax=Salvia miltiorrhiza TaxID=226208 RepID=UPI0025AC5723|nr:ankyrin repeat-containing protein At2g01680-like [Salvia miltiorrhiza]